MRQVQWKPVEQMERRRIRGGTRRMTNSNHAREAVHDAAPADQRTADALPPQAVTLTAADGCAARARVAASAARAPAGR
jgi:hypothetical protein